MRQYFLALLLSIFIIVPVQSQVEKLGRIRTSVIEEKHYERDTSVHAVVLFDVGRSHFAFVNRIIRSDENDNKGFQLNFERHIRIKIYNKAALDEGDFEILLRKQPGVEEKLTALKGFTFNMEGGRVKKSKIRMRDAFTKEINQYTDKVTFAMPNVKEGSVIDVRYTIQSGFLWSLRDWYFQKQRMPVKYSEYTIAIPEYYNYNVTMHGYEKLEQEKDMYNTRLELTFIQKARGSVSMQNAQRYTREYDYSVTEYKYMAENIPAFKEDSYLSTPKNYLSRVDFELSYTKFPWSTIKYYTTSWDDVTKTLMKHEDFGNRLNRSGFYSNKADHFKSIASDQKELMEMVYNDVQASLSWNNVYSIYAQNPRKTFNDGGGDIGDINIALIACLREAGLQAYPVLLSTRSHGIIMPAHASVNSFNYVVAHVQLDGQNYFLDASNPFACVNLLPPKCLNGDGRLVKEQLSEWITLGADGYKVSSFSALEFTADSVVANQQVKLEGYANYSVSQQYAKAADSTEFVNFLEKQLIKTKVYDYESENINECYQPVLLKMKVELGDYIQQAGDLMYFTPLFNFHTKTQPFKLEERKYPVEYPYPMSEQHVVSIQIPEGYGIESIPEPARVQLPDRKASFMYTIQQAGNNLQISCILSINQQIFPGNEYEFLKEFYTLVIEKQQEQVVLKKL